MHSFDRGWACRWVGRCLQMEQNMQFMNARACAWWAKIVGAYGSRIGTWWYQSQGHLVGQLSAWQVIDVMPKRAALVGFNPSSGYMLHIIGLWLKNMTQYISLSLKCLFSTHSWWCYTTWIDPMLCFLKCWSELKARAKNNQILTGFVDAHPCEWLHMIGPLLTVASDLWVIAMWCAYWV